MPLNFYGETNEELENDAALILAAANGNTLVDALQKLKMPITVKSLIEKLSEAKEAKDKYDTDCVVLSLIKGLEGAKEKINA